MAFSDLIALRHSLRQQLDSFKDKPWGRSRDVAAIYKDQLPACLAKRIEFGLQLGGIVQGDRLQHVILNPWRSSCGGLMP